MTRLAFYNYVLSDFKRDDKDTEIYKGYNDTIKHISNLEGVGNLKFQSYILLNAGYEDYPLPGDHCHIFHPIRFIEAINSTTGYPLNKMEKDDWSAKYPNPNNPDILTKGPTGRPVDYCVWSDSFLLGPVPDKSTYLVELDWSKKPTSQDFPADIHQLGEEWDEVLKWGTLARLYESIGLTDEADRYWALYRDDELGYPALIRKERDKNEKRMGSIKPGPGY
jgi:hypothetical protein